jgi:uncharacterized protein YeaO (DUF488 family)
VSIATKRIYQKPSPGDGYRVLVDRLWPRGVSRDEAGVDAWMKQVAPSDQLRRWFHSGPPRWGEFRRRYLAELKNHREVLRELAQRSRRERVTLLFGSRDEKRNNAVVVQQYLRMLGGG